MLSAHHVFKSMKVEITRYKLTHLGCIQFIGMHLSAFWDIYLSLVRLLPKQMQSKCKVGVPPFLTER